jgi:rhamnosyl/mannosyltransferase
VFGHILLQNYAQKGKKLKILHVYKSYYPDTQGGVERLIHMLSSQTSSMDCQNRLLTCTSQKSFHIKESKDLEVYYYPKTLELASSPFSYRLWKDFPKQAEWADIIHYHFPWPMADLLHCSWRTKKPSIVTYHSDVVRQKVLRWIYFPLMHFFLKRVHKIIATSQNYVNTSEILKNYVNKAQVIPIGIEAGHYVLNQETKLLWKSKLPSSFMLFVGVLRYYKGLEYLLQAIQGTSVKVVIAGNGPLRETLHHQTKLLNLTNQVIFTGAVSDEDLTALFSLAHGLVIPASHRSEAYCIALVEGLRFGLPLISTEIGTGTSFVNQQGETGLVVPACDPLALREALVSLWENKLMQEKMSKASFARFQSLFTAQIMAEKYLEVYKLLSANKIS